MSAMNNQISIIILAGGESSRMGEDKALLKIKGVSILEKICLLAKEVTSNIYIITFWPERYQSIIPSDCQLIPEVRRPLEKGSHGPLIGFAQALSYIQTEWVLLLACDLPKLTSGILQQGCQSLPNQQIMAYIPRNNNRWEPLCGFYHHSSFSSLRHYIEAGGTSFQGWLNSLTVQEWVINNPSVLFNCNTPEDFQNCSC